VSNHLDEEVRQFEEEFGAASEQRDNALRAVLSTMFPNPELTEEDRVEARRCETHFHTFVKTAWPHVESEIFVDGEHIRQMCLHMQAFSDGEIQNLAMNVPPQHCKSSIVSMMFPSWEWIRTESTLRDCVGPRERYLSFSYREDLALRDNWRARRLMQTAWYQARWGNRWTFSTDQNVKSRYVNSVGGQRVAASMGAAVGEGGTRIVLDDPQSYDDAINRDSRDKVIRFYTGSLSMRSFGLRTRKALIMQRLSMEDLTGYLQRQTAEGSEDWTFLVLPIVFEPTRACTTYRGKNERGQWRISNSPPEGWTDVQPFGGDWRTELGQPIWPELYGGEERAIEELEKVKRRTPDDVWAAQGLQHPVPPGGATFKSHTWFPLYDEIPGLLQLPERERPIIFTTWDCAIKDKETNDPTCGWVVAYYPMTREYYVLNRIWGRWEFVGQKYGMMTQARSLARYDPVHIVEGGGNGSGLVSACNESMGKMLRELGMERSGYSKRNMFYEWLPRGKSKIGRASLVSPHFREHRVLFPRWAHVPLKEKETPAMAAAKWKIGSDKWYWHAVSEFLEFPTSRHDDQVDALDQGIIWMETIGMELLLADVGEIHIGRPDFPDANASRHGAGLEGARDLSKMWLPWGNERPW
jgi:phage terminase large subunit-like protein